MFDVREKFQRYLEDVTSRGELQSLSKATASALYGHVNQSINFSGFHEITLDPEKSGGYDRALYCNFPAPSKANRFVMALNSQTGEIEMIGVAVHNRIREPDHVEKIEKVLLRNKKTPFPINEKIVVDNSLAKAKGEFRIPSLSDLENFMSVAMGASKGLVENALHKKARKFPVSQSQKSDFVRKATDECANIFRKGVDQFITFASDYFDRQAYEWATNIGAALQTQDRQNYNHVSIYNHIVCAPAEEAREYRYTALRQFAQLNELFFDQPVWDGIDKGESPLKCLAEVYSVKAATLKRMAKMEDVFSLGSETKQYAQILDHVDPQYWPSSKEDFFFFQICTSIADSYKQVLDKGEQGILRDWMKAHKRKDMPERVYWNNVAFHLLSSALKPMLTNPEDPNYVMKIMPRHVRKNKRLNTNASTDMNGPECIPVDMNNSKLLWKKALERYKRSVWDINDMKQDIASRILNPLLLMTLEARGYGISNADVLKGLSGSLRKSLWGGMTPTEQFSASSYWHSPRVNISRRFESAALNGKKNTNWHGLLEEPLELQNDIVAHSLVSSHDLREESNHMHHCVWSYTKSCLSGNSHIVSLREQDGERLSTLELRDFFNEQSRQRIVRINQNRSVRNAEPPAKALEAAAYLVKQINEGAIKPDWISIDNARAEYKATEVENAAGYDFRDSKQRESVFQVYEPCLPRKSGKTFEELAAHLKVDDRVGAFLEHYDLSQGGLISKDKRALQKRAIGGP